MLVVFPEPNHPGAGRDRIELPVDRHLGGIDRAPAQSQLGPAVVLLRAAAGDRFRLLGRELALEGGGLVDDEHGQGRSGGRGRRWFVHRFLGGRALVRRARIGGLVDHIRWLILAGWLFDGRIGFGGGVDFFVDWWVYRFISGLIGLGFAAVGNRRSQIVLGQATADPRAERGSEEENRREKEISKG